VVPAKYSEINGFSRPIHVVSPDTLSISAIRGIFHGTELFRSSKNCSITLTTIAEGMTSNKNHNEIWIDSSKIIERKIISIYEYRFLSK
jgi:hypothetical protein